MASFAQDPTDPTGVKDLTPRGSSDVKRARERKANAAVELRKTGASWDEVAEVLGFPTGFAAQRATEKALELELQNPESREFLRQLMGKRLDRLLRSVWAKAVDEDHPEQMQAHDRARQTLAMQIRLLGLETPTELIVHNPSQAEIEAWVGRVVAEGAPQVKELDIFEGEVVEDRTEFSG